jgi:alpha-beta hydrolase superfamily lysophospholipase
MWITTPGGSLGTVEIDVLGSPYEQMSLDLGTDDEGPVRATLVRRPADRSDGRAVLYVHGFTDYFFQTHLADFYCALGIDFYAIDLRKHGRSLDSHQSPNYVADVSTYFVELDEALRIIRDVDGHTKVLVNAHSTGGLTTPLWAHRRRADGVIDAMFLNSPFFEFNVPPAVRRTVGPTFAAIAKARPYALVPTGLNEVYGHSLHHDHHGEWDYDLAWKPIGGFPVRAGWLTAIRRAQARLHAGLDIPVPVLIGSSAATFSGAVWSDEADRADAVLDPAHMTRWATAIGRHVTLVRFAGARHDLALSQKLVRDQVFAELTRWIGAYLPA